MLHEPDPKTGKEEEVGQHGLAGGHVNCARARVIAGQLPPPRQIDSTAKYCWD